MVIVLAGSLRSWTGTNELVCGSCPASNTDLTGNAIVPLVSSPPVPSAAINRILPKGCCREDAGTIMFCIGNGAGLVVSKKFLCWGTLIAITDCGGGEQDVWLISASVLITCTRGGGEEVDDRERRTWNLFSSKALAGGEGVPLLEEVVVGNLFCSISTAVLKSWTGGWIPLHTDCWGITRIVCPAIVWITFMGVCPLLMEMPFAVIGMKHPLAAGCLFGWAWRMFTGDPLVAAGRTGAWINVGVLLACTKLTVPFTAPGAVPNTGARVTSWPWLLWGSREVNTFDVPMLSGPCSLGLVAAARHICLGDNWTSELGSSLRFRLTTEKWRTEFSP